MEKYSMDEMGLLLKQSCDTLKDIETDIKGIKDNHILKMNESMGIMKEKVRKLEWAVYATWTALTSVGVWAFTIFFNKH